MYYDTRKLDLLKEIRFMGGEAPLDSCYSNSRGIIRNNGVMIGTQ
jgi:hypothetical protein